MAFRCKQFSVEDGRSTLPVGTDAMLLGAWADPGDASTILDIGTGCGILALMMAQKSKAVIDAIDIDDDSVAQASSNFRSSPWSGRLHASCMSLHEFSAGARTKYDVVISNPPFFSGSLRSPDHRRNLAKHDAGLDLTGLLAGVSRLLADTGQCFLILPADNRDLVPDLAGSAGLYLYKFLLVRPVGSKQPKRALMEFSRTQHPNPAGGFLTICGEDGRFTPEYVALTENFHYF
jgi:tRNA1Val (adenine37-N6)-methyltransferase